MKRLLLMMCLLPSLAIGQGIYASLDGSISDLDINGTVTIGYHTQGIHVGVGTGMSKVTFQNSVIKSYGLYHPVFIELSWLSPRREISPFLAVRGGLLLNGSNGVFNSPINIDGSTMAAAKTGVAFKRKSVYVIPFFAYNYQLFDKAGSRNVGVNCRVSGLGAGVNLVFYQRRTSANSR